MVMETPNKWVVAGVLLLVAYLSACYYSEQLHQAMVSLSPPTSSGDDFIHVCYNLDDFEEKEAREREESKYWLLFARGSSVLRAWPSEQAGGGVWEKHDPNGPELDFINVSRAGNLPRPSVYSAAEEDAFARKLRLIGAVWRPLDNKQGEDEYERKRRWLGWPSGGGVWAYECRELEFRASKEVGEMAGRWRVALTMDEAVEVLRSGRAVFYPNPASFPPLADLFSP
ncbi:hypothetical protein FQN49_001934 [Arthroderma sp. PD_2]|nr:hypothetical protein FQN49_001934 [Arthroderma sp. PD_2]